MSEENGNSLKLITVDIFSDLEDDNLSSYTEWVDHIFRPEWAAEAFFGTGADGDITPRRIDGLYLTKNFKDPIFINSNDQDSDILSCRSEELVSRHEFKNMLSEANTRLESMGLEEIKIHNTMALTRGLGDGSDNVSFPRVQLDPYDELPSAWGQQPGLGTPSPTGSLTPEERMSMVHGDPGVEHEVVIYQTGKIKASADAIKNMVSSMPSANVNKRESIVNIKQSNTPARIMIMKEWDDDGPSESELSYADFILTSVSESDQEKYQIVETMGRNNFLYFYGKRPAIYSFSGILMNSDTEDWMRKFNIIYDLSLRGTRCAEEKMVAYIQYDGRIVEGYILSANKSQDSQNEKFCQFSISFYVTNLIIINADRS